MIMDALTDNLPAETSGTRNREEAPVDYHDHNVSNLRDELQSQIALERAVGALRHLISRDPLAADMKLSLFASSVFSYRWAKTANPLPPEFAAAGSSLAAVEALRNIPAVRRILTERSALKHAPPASLRLLQWLLTGPGGVTLRVLPRPPPAAEHPLPDFTFQVNNPTLTEKWQSQSQNKTIVTGFLGQPLDIYHRIVHLGLPVGETPMKLRRDMATAIQDSSPGYGLRSSELGTPLLCVAECHCAMVLPGASPWHSAGESYLLLYDGRLALVTRIFAFKGCFLKHSLGRKDRAISSFKLPQFKFQVTHASSPEVGVTPDRLKRVRQPLFLNPLTIESPTSQYDSNAEPKNKATTKAKGETESNIRPKFSANTHSSSITNPARKSELRPIMIVSPPTLTTQWLTAVKLEPKAKHKLEPEPEVEVHFKCTHEDLRNPVSSSKAEVEIVAHSPNDWSLQSKTSIGELEPRTESTTMNVARTSVSANGPSSVDELEPRIKSTAKNVASTSVSANGSTERHAHCSGKPTLGMKIHTQINVSLNQGNNFLRDMILILSLIWIRLRNYIRYLRTMDLWRILVISSLLTGGI